MLPFQVYVQNLCRIAYWRSHDLFVDVLVACRRQRFYHNRLLGTVASFELFLKLANVIKSGQNNYIVRFIVLSEGKV